MGWVVAGFFEGTKRCEVVVRVWTEKKKRGDCDARDNRSRLASLVPFGLAVVRRKRERKTTAER